MKALATALLIVGCSGCSSPEPGPSLQGLWAVGNTLGLKVTRSSYELAGFVGTRGVEVELGTFTVDGDLLDTFPTQASCPSHDHRPASLRYQLVDSDHLRLSLPQGIVVFERVPDSPGSSGSIPYGCVDSGAFTPHPLEDL